MVGVVQVRVCIEGRVGKELEAVIEKEAGQGVEIAPESRSEAQGENLGLGRIVNWRLFLTNTGTNVGREKAALGKVESGQRIIGLNDPDTLGRRLGTRNHFFDNRYRGGAVKHFRKSIRNVRSVDSGQQNSEIGCLQREDRKEQKEKNESDCGSRSSHVDLDGGFEEQETCYSANPIPKLWAEMIQDPMLCCPIIVPP